ncbi:arylsulfatase [Actinopolymorpha cephalotaxi]|uniref:Arylsulfatase n=1 Tax=Actinopolymorpha cephalotaxi TaxID=504797 RepID=A0A1I3BA42_9ACTN|nr:arylsulfatase [Actinopolymorpha cephalotaxi]NYH86802.1 arylsulfatase [Actinopolymorpha cephalotaxi]SFH59158.1 arylsulfatase [Actinopolymorpha cephalotaxi]
MTGRPNVIVILVDDMGYSDIGCYGGEIPTPNLDRLAAGGVRLSQFYNTARCSPSRASLLTGLHPHQTGIGILTEDQRPYGYPGTLNDRCVTLAEVLGAGGYATYMSGKWHLCGQVDRPHDAWPTRRGFDRFFGTLTGAGNYWNPGTLTRDETPVEDHELEPGFFYTDAIGAAAADFVTSHSTGDDAGRPFFLYTAFTAPHWPLHALEEDIEAMRGRYAEGWDVLRERRADRLVDLGVLEAGWNLSDRDPDVKPWNDTANQNWEQRRMEVYAAQVHRMDAAVGRIVAALEATGHLDDTVLMFLSDNGGCAENLEPGWTDELENRPIHLPAHTRAGGRVFRGNTPAVVPGAEDTYASYGTAWANLSNTPFREYKHWVHEGGIATPFIVHWPAGRLAPGTVRHDPHQLPDVMATVLDVTGVDHPSGRASGRDGRDVLPPEGVSMLRTWHGDGRRDSVAEPEHTLYWEHEGNAAVRQGRWKLVRKFGQDWELYDLDVDRTELNDVAGRHPGLVDRLGSAYAAWAGRCGVVPREQILARRTAGTAGPAGD